MQGSRCTLSPPWVPAVTAEATALPSQRLPPRACPAPCRFSPLLECITVIRTVSGWMAAATSAALTRPSSFTGTAV